MKKIAVLGSSNMDFVFSVKEMPRTGETIKSLEFHKVPGGKGANQACACGKLGGDCIFLSAVGKDDSGEILLDSLKRAGVCTEKVLRVKNDTTGMAAIMVNAKGPDPQISKIKIHIRQNRPQQILRILPKRGLRGNLFQGFLCSINGNRILSCQNPQSLNMIGMFVGNKNPIQFASLHPDFI